MQRSLPHWKWSPKIRTSRKGPKRRKFKKQKDDRFLCGRQLAFYDLRTFPGNRHSCGWSRLLWSIQSFFRGDDVQVFDTRWDEVSLSFRQVPSDDILESLYKTRMRGSDQLEAILVVYEHRIFYNHLARFARGTRAKTFLVPRAWLKARFFTARFVTCCAQSLNFMSIHLACHVRHTTWRTFHSFNT